LSWMPCLIREVNGADLTTLSLGHPLIDDYLSFVGARGRRNTWLAIAFDLKVFFTVVPKDPAEVSTADVFAFIKAQRAGRRGEKVVRLEDGEPGLAARTIKRRLSSISGLYSYLIARGDAGVSANPVPRGLATRRANARPGARGVPLIRAPRTLPRVLTPGEVNQLTAALRTNRDRAMVDAMVLGALRRCEVLGLQLGDLHPGEKRVFIAEGKGGHQRIVPVSGRFFSNVADYLNGERPTTTTTQLFVVLKGSPRGGPLSAAGLDQIIRGARQRASLDHLTCHQLRHTCLTRLREAGMALEAVQAQAGHRSIESTRIYLHLANDWLTTEYTKAVDAIEAAEEAMPGGEG
jgi:integrase/recombinase XerD